MLTLSQKTEWSLFDVQLLGCDTDGIITLLQCFSFPAPPSLTTFYKFLQGADWFSVSIILNLAGSDWLATLQLSIVALLSTLFFTGMMISFALVSFLSPFSPWLLFPARILVALNHLCQSILGYFPLFQVYQFVQQAHNFPLPCWFCNLLTCARYYFVLINLKDFHKFFHLEAFLFLEMILPLCHF